MCKLITIALRDKLKSKQAFYRLLPTIISYLINRGREISDSREQWLKMRVTLNHYHVYKKVNVMHASKYIKSQMAEEVKLATMINDPFKLSEERNGILYREMTGTVASEEAFSRITEKQDELMQEILPQNAKAIEKEYVEYRLAEGLIKRELFGENIKGDIAKKSVS